MASDASHTTSAQLRHRMALVEYWAPKAGDRVLEVGCGQGDCTVVLAHAVGGRGKVVAADVAPPTYGAPVSLGETHRHLLSSGVGKQIEFHTCANLLDPIWEFPDDYFDLAVFAHCSWYMASPHDLKNLFSRVRTWSKRLGYAEWHPAPQNLSQIPHLIAILSQAHIRSYWPDHGIGNVQSLVTPDQARSMAQAARWAVVDEQVTDSSRDMEDGESWEIDNARHQFDEIVDSKAQLISERARELFASERDLLNMLARQGKRSPSPHTCSLESDR